MEQIIYKTKIIDIGEKALDFVNENMVILFNKKVQPQLAEYSILIEDAQSLRDIKAGDYLRVENNDYIITAVGEVASKNLNNLGHVVIKFDGKTNPELPGNIHVQNKGMPNFKKDIEIFFIKK